jgi:sulfate permease, SulP family
VASPAIGLLGHADRIRRHDGPRSRAGRALGGGDVDHAHRVPGVTTHLPELGRLDGTDSFVELGRHPDATTYPGAAIVRIETALYFTNAEVLANRLRRLERDGLTTIVLDASGVNYLDSTADHQLRKLAVRYRERGVRLLLVNVEEPVRAVMDTSGFTDLVGSDAFFPTDADAVARLESRRGPSH